MSASDDYCELCDLPKSQCIHGQPPPAPPAPTVRTTPKPRTAPVVRKAAAPSKPRRWSPPEVFKPLILAVLAEGGGEMDADDVFLELEILAEGKLLAGDNELTPEGELRWRYAVRRARVDLLKEGLMVKAGPGVWKLA